MRDIRPYRSAQEFVPHSSRLLKRRSDGHFCRVSEFNDHFAKIDGVAYTWPLMAEQYVFADSGFSVGANRSLTDFAEFDNKMKRWSDNLARK